MNLPHKIMITRLLDPTIEGVTKCEDPGHCHSNWSFVDDVDIDRDNCGIILWIGPSR